MKLTVGQLRRTIREAGKIAASPEYMKKERVREKLQQLIVDRVATGEIANQAELEQFIKDVDVSMMALKMVPFDVWAKMAGKVPTKPIKKK